MKDKEKILRTLKDFGISSTSRIAAIAGLFYPKTKTLLEELKKEKKVCKKEETNSTYWFLNQK